MEKSYVIICGKLFDGKRAELLSSMEILVEGKIIKEVGRNLSRPQSAEVVDLSHLTVTPGMIDAHMHSDMLDWTQFASNFNHSSEWFTLSHLHTAQRCLERGFTTIRTFNINVKGFGLIDVKRMINAGYFPGARMVVSGHMLGSTGSHGDMTQNLSGNPDLADAATGAGIGNGVEFFREAVRREVKYGSDCIKIMLSGGFFTPNDTPVDQQLSDEELSTIISTARGLRKPVTAHVYHPPLMQKLVEFGITGLEHASMMDEETAEMIEKAGIYVVPTFSPYDEIIRADEENLAKKPPEFQAKLREYSDKLISGRDVIINSKIKLGYGSDFVTVHQCYESWYEYDSWLKSGVDPFRALKAATSVNSEILELSNYIGSIEPGKYADIAAWSKDLLNESDALSECVFVMKEGKIYPALHGKNNVDMNIIL
ncbi:MAG: amidohydrolase family protein [Peptococcaceae bacterium]